MARLDAERLLLDALAVRTHTATHYPHALGVAQRLVDAACLALNSADIKEAA